MIDLLSLVKDSPAYRTVLGDKRRDTLSHAYLLLSADGEFLDGYLKLFAKTLLCEKDLPCDDCRTCRLIEQNSYPDVYFYPKNGESVTAEEVTSLIDESYIKPIEGKTKVFILSHAENMNASAQNKLLKTLEEPPAGVIILIGSTSEFSLLPTVKSRVKKLEILPFTAEKIFEALKDECKDQEKLLRAVSCGDGTLGKAKSLYFDEKLQKVTDLVIKTLTEMKSSSDVLKFSTEVLKETPDPSEFISLLELYLRDLLCIYTKKGAPLFNKSEEQKLKSVQGFTVGSILYALDALSECEKRKKFNANPTMLTEWLLFKILEGKHKWQKL
jgi:DNA polymerase-3 subunit delta'